ncbi:MAG: SCP2 sterol-binding domain-containing protein [Defluviitaleaceae bacterium]|nr:SCP2 sterol-binding domain-containing protein [Defluviitaleaceae bacterium]
MKIAAIIAPSATDFGLNVATKLVCDTLTETGETVQVFNLDTLGVGIYDGSDTTRVHDIMEGIKSADGVIFAFSALFGSPCATALAFLEYFNNNSYRSNFKGKPCLLLAVSENGGERPALEIMAGGVLQLGGFDVVRIGLNVSVAAVVQKDVIELIERQSEDFYRILRQNRKYVLSPVNLPAVNVQADLGWTMPAPTDIASDWDMPSQTQQKEARRLPTMSVGDLYKKHNLDNMSGEQQKDISKISAMFAKKYVSDNDAIVEQKQPHSITTPANTGFTAERSVKQLTAALPHHFNTQLAKDLDTIIQLNITGMGGFTGHITITNQECFFYEWEAEKNDIVVIADAKVWEEVLHKKITAQKAFMMGQLKVRGNFVLLTKFDQLFNALA